ncbi:glycerol-3-phosphate acyltransferase PlsY [Gammaproteobacteria bacterium]|nr:glycerol-3-phosphate acyltransferase PlsY [Gammaproteobacteria bacterium]
MWQWLLAPIAYLLGSLSSAVITSRLMGLPDPREEGSKNPGATNVLRLGGKQAAIITLLGDLAKGLIPLVVAKALGASAAVLATVGLAAFLGHLYPVFFGFKGGKGAATAGGVFFGYSWLAGLAVMLTWIAVAFVSRISSLSALVAAALAPVYIWFIVRSPELVIASTLMAAILFWRHQSNIQRILRGEESKIGR